MIYLLKTKFTEIKTILAVALALATLAGCQGRTGADIEPPNAPTLKPVATAQVSVIETPWLTSTPAPAPSGSTPTPEPVSTATHNFAPASEGIKNVFRTGITIMPNYYNVEFANRDLKLDFSKTQNDIDTTITLSPTEIANGVTLVFEGVILAAYDIKSLFYQCGTDGRNSATFIENTSKVILNDKIYYSVQFSIPIKMKTGISKVVIGTFVENKRNVLWNVEISEAQMVSQAPTPTPNPGSTAEPSGSTAEPSTMSTDTDVVHSSIPPLKVTLAVFLSYTVM